MNSSGYHYYERFEELLRDMLRSERFFVNPRPSLMGPDTGVDIIASPAEGPGTPLLIQVKLYTRREVSLRMLREAASKQTHLGAVGNRILAVGGDADPAHKEWVKEQFHIDVWDRRELIKRAHGQIREKLVTLFDELDRERVSAEPIEKKPAPLPLGVTLIEKLQNVKPGNKQAKAYEGICKEIISYLFGEDLRDVRSQQGTEDKLNFYDLIFRATPKHAFWMNLTRDMRARVVLFECKNYSKAITPAQVYTTERYLSISALRPICFVLSRKTSHPHAMQAAFGAMRESGKLLVFLSDEDLIQMLKSKDVQLNSPEDRRPDNDPTEILDQKIYEFIAGMPR